MFKKSFEKYNIHSAFGMDSIGSYQGIFNQSSITTDASELIITGLIDNKVIGSLGGILTNNVSTDGLDEGKTNLYYTDDRARNAISGSSGIIYYPITGQILNGGVISLGGTANRIFVSSDSYGNYTLNLPQDIATNSSPQFARISNSSINAYNQIIGTEAGLNYNGPFSVIIGHQAVYQTSTASQLVGIGYRSLYNCTGNYNTAIGSTAGYEMTSGNANVMVGCNAGRGTYPITTGASNVYLGYNAYPSASNASGEIVIGANATGKGSNTCYIKASSGLNVSNLTTGVLKATSGLITSDATTDDLTEGKTNLYFTTARAQGAFTAGTGISIISGVITNTSPATISSITGTANRVIVSGSGALTLSTPQDIATSSGPQFAYLNVSSIGTQNIAYTDGVNLSPVGAGGNCILGALSGDSITTGGKNIALGLGVMSGGLTPLTNADGQNIGVGTGSLNVLQGIAQYNLALGAYSGQNLTSANYNIFYGSYAGNSVSTSSNNIAIGNSALGLGGTKLTTTNGQNVCVGNYSGYTLQGTANANTAVGNNALYSATTSNNNTCIGQNSGYYLTTGSNNTGIGGISLGGITTGSYNVALGYNTLTGLTTGSNNVHIGINTQSRNTTATSAIVINAQSATTAVDKGDNTCFINAPSGFYSHIPAFYFGYISGASGGNFTPSVLSSRGITSSSNLITLPYIGTYEVSLSGTVVTTGVPFAIYHYVAGVLYPYAGINNQYYSAIAGYVPVSYNCFVTTTVINTTTNFTYYTPTFNAINPSAPTFITIKYIGL